MNVTKELDNLKFKSYVLHISVDTLEERKMLKTLFGSINSEDIASKADIPLNEKEVGKQMYKLYDVLTD